MEGVQVKLPLAEVYKALKAGDNNKSLKALARTGLREMAERHQVGYSIETPRIDYDLVLPLVDDVVKKVVEESKKFNPLLPYPPQSANNMSIQIELPTKGKVGVTEFNQTVVV